jgi:hypothetical protein
MSRGQSTRVPRTCPVCHKPYLIWPHEAREGQGRFCSRECFFAAVSAGLVSRKRRKPLDRPTVVCPTCGAAFQPVKSEFLRGGGKYCSRSCYRKGSVIPLGRQFLNGVSESDGTDCLIWTGPMRPSGYGQISSTGERRNVGAHRFAFELAHGSIPSGLHVLHSCDNPACVNPLHLSLGTPLDNSRDKVAKGRHIKGERCYLSKLTEQDVREIREAYASGRMTQKALAAKYQTCLSNVLAILNRRSWRHLT